MSAYRRSLWTSVLSILIVAAICLPGCERKPETTTSSEPAATATAGTPARIGILPEGQDKPNVIMILVDALRADRLAAYGSRAMITPVMDTIATEGVVFERCVAATPWTLPSIATLFTSYYPKVHKATSYRAVESMEQGRQAYLSILGDDFDTLAEVLQTNGWQTAGFCSNKFIRKRYGYAQGFDYYDTSFADNTVRGDKVNQALFNWLDGDGRDKAKPMFLYLHYMDVHGPYNAAPQFMDPLMKKVEENPDKTPLEPKEMQRLNPYLKKPPAETSDPTRYERLKGYREYWEARYNAGVQEADFYLHQLVQNLSKRGLWDNSYVILLADHGEALCEHGMWDHGYSQYQTDLHVPLIMRWPKVLPPGKRVRELASLIDVMPTIMEQLRIPPGEALQGTSLVDHLSGTLPDVPLVRFAEAVKSGPQQYALFADVTKLMVTAIPPQKLPDGTMSGNRVRHELYNLGTDPGETINVAQQNTQVVNSLGKIMEGIIRQNLQTKPETIILQKPVDEKTISDLQSLGYVGGYEEDDEEDEPAAEPATTQPAITPEGGPGEDHP